jgi:hypothetical protein
MGTDVPVQLDGASDVRDCASDGQNVVHVETHRRKGHKEKHAKRPREGKEKERHKHSKHRKKLKSNHGSPDSKSKTEERIASPAGKLAGFTGWHSSCAMSCSESFFC